VDTGDWTLLSLWVHIPVVTIWIGLVMLDAFASSAPELSQEQRGRLIAWSRWPTLVLIAIILITGVWQTMKNPFSEVGSYSELKALREDTTYGMALFLKHGAVLATFILTLVVRFYFAPRLLHPHTATVTDVPATVPAGGTAAMAAPATQNLAAVRWLSILNLLACLAALIFATRMVWELH
jgi:putative copper export protein